MSTQDKVLMLERLPRSMRNMGIEMDTTHPLNPSAFQMDRHRRIVVNTTNPLNPSAFHMDRHGRIVVNTTNPLNSSSRNLVVFLLAY
ncbi:unnamed protein product [Adineta ricciae]|uniref:Uncharacterized protein n=1 Tax=Adineta ricciae TaxID=249248 RepID=A0A815TD61_ADIRI|nr:unnamed protein product [Adineta ricciae]CAF1606948.1 unnamed protein product [Adineta ricciae]